jgi:hypothetical protein
MPGLISFSATRRRTGLSCVAAYTVPNPPLPSAAAVEPARAIGRRGVDGVAEQLSDAGAVEGGDREHGGHSPQIVSALRLTRPAS